MAGRIFMSFVVYMVCPYVECVDLAVLVLLVQGLFAGFDVS